MLSLIPQPPLLHKFPNAFSNSYSSISIIGVSYNFFNLFAPFYCLLIVPLTIFLLYSVINSPVALFLYIIYDLHRMQNLYCFDNTIKLPPFIFC